MRRRMAAMLVPMIIPLLSLLTATVIICESVKEY